MAENMDDYKYIAYSSQVPDWMTCIKVGAKKTEKNLLKRVRCSMWSYPTFSYLEAPDKLYLSPYGNLFWMYDCVWVKEPIEVDVFVRGNRQMKMMATVETHDGDDIWKICSGIQKTWK